MVDDRQGYEHDRQVRSLMIYTAIVLIAMLFVFVLLLLPRCSEPEEDLGVADNGAKAGSNSGGGGEDGDLKRRLSDVEASLSLGEMCLGKCNCLCYYHRNGGKDEPLTVCRLSQEACLALENKVRGKVGGLLPSRAVGNSVSVPCRQVDLREVDRKNGVARHEWLPSKRNGGELFGIFYPGKCLLE